MSDASDIKAELLVLKAENAELRRERDFYFQQVTENGERAHEAIDALNAENAKLLELLRPLVDFADFECNLMYDCTACQMISGDRPCYLVKALRYLHELGVDA